MEGWANRDGTGARWLIIIIIVFLSVWIFAQEVSDFKNGSTGLLMNTFGVTSKYLDVVATMITGLVILWTGFYVRSKMDPRLVAYL